mgnify:CR=1 FL=1
MLQIREPPKYVKQLLTELKRETDLNTIIVEDLNTPLSNMDRSSKQKINMVITSLNDTLDQMDIIDIYRAFYPKAAAYTFFSSAHGTLVRIHHILGHKIASTNIRGLKSYQPYPLIIML